MVAPGNADEFQYNWEKLESALRDIHLKNASGLAFEQLYRHSYKIVLKKAGDRLYDNVKQFEENWFTLEVSPPIFKLVTKNLINMTLSDVPGSSVVERRAMGEKFLKAIRDAWEEHNTAMNMIADILMYLDRGYSQGQSRPTIFAVTIGLFRDHILWASLAARDTDCRVYNIFNATILDQINMEREGDAIDKALLHSCTNMLESLHRTDEENENEKLYLEIFEPAFLASSRAFYQGECDRLLANGDAAAWLRHTQRRLEEETARCTTTISPTSLPGILRVVEDELIKKNLQEFLNLDGSGVRAMIDNDRVDDLRILYQLVARVDTQKSALIKALYNRVMELGLEIEKVLKSTDFSTPKPTEEPVAQGGDKAKPKALNAAAQQTAAAIKWVADVLNLKERFDRLLFSCFADDLVIQTALNKSFSEFINLFDRSSEYLSLFIDHNLKSGIKDKSDAEVERVLEQAITLLRYVSEKDKFEVYYQKHLAKRLLHQKSESHEIETEMISRMKRELGNNFTHKFEGMFKDIRMSKEMTEAYAKHVRGLGEANERQVDLSINVLGGNNWPKEISGRNTFMEHDQAGLNYPPEIRNLQESFFKFYSKDRTGRKLTWAATAGSADIKCLFPKIPGKSSGPLSKDRRYELTVSTYGMIILLLFNDLPEGEWLSLEDIEGRTNIPQTDLINALTSLSVVKTTKVLLKEPATKAIVKAGDRFTFNREFTSKTFKIKMGTVNATSKVENEEERKETNDKNADTRKYVVDAAIVRIMK